MVELANCKRAGIKEYGQEQFLTTEDAPMPAFFTHAELIAARRTLRRALHKANGTYRVNKHHSLRVQTPVLEGVDENSDGQSQLQVASTATEHIQLPPLTVWQSPQSDGIGSARWTLASSNPPRFIFTDPNFLPILESAGF